MFIIVLFPTCGSFEKAYEKNDTKLTLGNVN